MQICYTSLSCCTTPKRLQICHTMLSCRYTKKLSCRSVAQCSTPLSPRISAGDGPSAADLAATVQQLLDGSLRGIERTAPPSYLPPPATPTTVHGRRHQQHLPPVADPRAATAERQGTYGQPAAARASRARRDGRATAHSLPCRPG